MEKIIKFGIFAWATIMLASCGMFNNEPTFTQDDLVGYWQEKGTTHYVRFSKEESAEKGYLLGYEWTEPEAYEEDVLREREEVGRPANGWFKYLLEKTRLTELHLTTISEAEVTKEYTVTTLTDTQLVYKDEDRGKTFTFEKVVAPKH